MQKKAVLFSAGEYLNSNRYNKADLDLSGVKYDIAAIEKRLKQIGFDVTKKENANKADYFDILRDMAHRAPSDAIHIVYFSGHGGHCNGKNYIYPSDFGVLYDNNYDIDEASINIQDIISAIKGKGRLILILDACRSDFGTSKGHFSEMTSSDEVYIAYGTMFQTSATGVENSMSWFTEAICDEILTPNIDADTLFTRVRQNVFTKHYVQLPVSVNGLLENVVLHIECEFDNTDKEIYDFVEKYGDGYNDRYGYFQGEDLVFIDAAQFYNIGLLDAYWKYTKVQNKLAEQKGIRMPILSESEQKLVHFLGFTRSPKRFSFDSSHTWYYNGRQIRMGEIPPLPPSMQQKLPEKGKELYISINAEKRKDEITIKINLPNYSEIFIYDNISKFSKKYIVQDGKVVINNASDISHLEIDSGVFSNDPKVQNALGDKCRNIVGEHVKYHPIYGNNIKYETDF